MQKEKENVQPTFINYYYYNEFLFSLKKMWMGSAPASSHIDDTVKKRNDGGKKEGGQLKPGSEKKQNLIQNTNAFLQ